MADQPDDEPLDDPLEGDDVQPGADPGDLDVSELEDDPAYDPEEDGLKDIKGG